MTVKTFIANPNGVSIEKDAILYGEYTPLGRLQYVQLATSPNLAPYISTDGASRPGEIRWVINTTAPVQGPSWVNFSIQNYAPGPFVNNIVYPQDFGAVGDGITDDTAAIQAAIDACEAAGGGTVFFPPGTYLVNTFQTNSDGLQYGLTVGSKVTLYLGSATIKSSVTLTSTNNLIINNSPNSGGNTGIVIEGGYIICASPILNTTGLEYWQNAINFYGVSNSIVRNCTITNGGISFSALMSVQNTPNALTEGNSSNNIIELCNFINQTGSTAFFQSTNCKAIYCYWGATWDDPLLIGSAGIGHIVDGCIFDSPPVQSNMGASTACVYLINDHAVSNSPSVMKDIIISNTHCMSHNGYNGGTQSGIGIIGPCESISISKCNTSYNNVGIYLANTGALLDGIVITKCAIHHNVVNGIDLEDPATSTSASFCRINITNNRIYNNNQGGSGGYGVKIYTYGASSTITGVMVGTLAENMIYDDQVTPTQINSIWLYVDSTLANGGMGINVHDNIIPLISGGSIFSNSNFGIGSLEQCFVNGNRGYNPVGSVAASVPASGTATTALPYDATFYITASTSTVACAVTDASGTSQTVATIPASGFAGVFVPAGSTLTPTYTAAPTWTVQGH